MAGNMLPISSNTLADRVVDRLRDAIITGELAPGERLAEPAVAEWMGISRSPVREALRRIEAMGLARRRTNYSACVWEPAEDDVDEIMSLRVMIETFAATHLVSVLTEGHLAHLEALIAQQERAALDQRYLELVAKDREFHEYMCQQTENHRLLEWWNQIMVQWEVLVVRRWHYEPMKVVPQVLIDHRAIVDALRRRDLQGLLDLHREINAEVREETKKMLRVQAAGAAGGRLLPAKEEEVAFAQ